MKKYFSFSFTLLLLVSFLLGTQLVKNAEFLHPLGTTTSFELYLGKTQLSKQAIVRDLQQIATANDAIILKPNTDSRTYGSIRDLYYFSKVMPTQGVPAVSSDGHLSWLNDSLSGQIRSADAIGEAPLSGTYHITHSAQVEKALEQWSQANNLTLHYQEPASPLSRLYIIITQTGLGISYVAILLLNLSLVIADILRRSYLRSVQFLNGINPTTIHKQQFFRILSSGLLGALLGIMLSSAYIWIYHSKILLLEVLLTTFPFAFGGIILVLAANLIISLIFAPNSKVIRTRKPPIVQYRYANLGIQITAVTICVIAIAASVGLGKSAFSSYRIQLSSKALGQSVAVSVKDFDYLDTPQGIKDTQNLLSAPDIEETTALSLNIGSTIEVAAEELGNYDELNISNRIFLQLIGIEDKSLHPVEWASLPAQTQDFLNAQLPLWTQPSLDFRKAFSLYTLTENNKNSFISLDANVGYSGSINHPTHPLIIIPEVPLPQLNPSFTIPSISTGNILFTKAELIRDSLYTSNLASSIRSIDRIADAGLVSLQYFRAQISSYLFAIIISLGLISITAWQAATIWAKEHKQHIFIAKTMGVRAKSIYLPSIKQSLLFTSTASLVGAVLSVFTSGYASILDGVITLIITIALFGLASLLFFSHATQKSFSDSILRKE